MSEKLKQILIRFGAIATIGGSAVGGSIANNYINCDEKFVVVENQQSYEVCVSNEQVNALKQELEKGSWRTAVGTWDGK